MALIRDSVGIALPSAVSLHPTGYGAAKTNFAAVMQKFSTVDGFAHQARFDNYTYPANWIDGSDNPITAGINDDSDVIAYLDIIQSHGGTGMLVIVGGASSIPGSGLAGQAYNASTCQAKMSQLADSLRRRSRKNLGTTAGDAFYIAFEGGNEINLAGNGLGAANGLTPQNYLRFYKNFYAGLKAGDPSCYVGPGSCANSVTTRTGASGHNIFGYAEGSGTRFWSQLDWHADCLFAGAQTGGEPTFATTGFDFLCLHPYPVGGSGLTGSPSGGTRTTYSLGDASMSQGANGQPWRQIKWLSQMAYDALIAAGKTAAFAAAHALIDLTECAPGSPIDRWRANTTYINHWVVYYAGNLWTANAAHVSNAAAPPGAGGPWVQGPPQGGSPSPLGAPVYNGSRNNQLYLVDSTVTWWDRMWQHFFGYAADVDGVWLTPNSGVPANNATRQMTRIIWPFMPFDEGLISGSFHWGLLEWGPANAPNGPTIGLNEKGGTSTTTNPYRKLLTYAPLTDPRTAAPPTVPAQVGTVTAAPGPGRVVLDWAAPADGGSAITGYRVVLDPPASGPYIVTPSTITITGLADGVTYSTTVQAINTVGTGQASIAVTFRPTGPTIGPFDDWTADGTVVPKVDWETLTENVTAPGNSIPTFTSDGAKLHIVQDRDTRSMFWPLGQTLVLDREVRSKLVDIDSHGLRQPGHVHRLLNPGGSNEVAVTVTRNIQFGVDYNFNVHLMGRAITDNVAFAGAGGFRQLATVNFCVAGDAACVTPHVPPYASTVWLQYPLNMKTRLVGNILDLAVWLDSESEPAYGAAAPARTATWTLADAQLPAVPGYDGWYIGHITGTQWIELDNLAATKYVVPSTPPTAPRNPTATAGDTTVALSWLAPTNPGTSPVTNYRVTIIGGAGGTVPLGNVLSTTITGLTNGVSYRFTVAATNASGFSAESVQSNAVTPVVTPTVPTVPRSVTAAAGNGQASLSWLAPTNAGTTPVSGYRVTVIGGIGGTVNVGNVLSAVVPGLTNGISYRFTVAALNSVGYSNESSQSNAVTPVVPPPPPPPNPTPKPVPLPVPPSTEALLDGKIQNRADRFVFELLDKDMVPKGMLDVDASRIVTVTFDTGRNAAFRTMEGLSIPRGDLANIDPLSDRVRANVVLQNDAQFPIGVFRFGSNVKAPTTYGVTYSPSMFDDGWVLDQKTSATITAQKGTTAHTLIARVLGRLGIDFADVVIDAPDATYADTAAWRTGTSHYAILRDVALFLGCYPPYYTNTGILRFRTVANDNPAMQHRYAKGYRIVQDTILETDDSFQTPNEWVAIGSNTNGEVVGSYLVPKSAPYSFAQRGVRITETVDLPGSPDSAHAKASARAAALRDSRRIYLSVTFGALLDPRHDGFDVFSYDGLPFLEQSWRIECQSGAPMTHTGTRLWADAADQ